MASNLEKYNRDILTRMLIGVKVERDAEALTNALTPIFTIAGGRVLMTGFLGEITVASGANEVHIEATPTTGTSQPVAANLDINPALVGDALTITGKGDDAMTYNASTTGLQMMSAGPVVLNEGTLDYHAAAADGTVAWTMWYVPLDEGAYVEAT